MYDTPLIDANDSFFSCSSTDDFESANGSTSSNDDSVPLNSKLRLEFSTNRPSLNIVHINAQSIPAHYSDLLTSFNSVPVDCILISESWPKPSLPSSYFSLQDFILVRNDRIKGRGGGVCIYIRKDLTHSVIDHSPNITRGNLEYLFTEIIFSHSKVLLGVAYSPSPSVDYFNNLEILLDMHSPNYDHVIIMGDFNTCLLKQNCRSKKLMSLISSFNLHVLPLSATHFSPHSEPSLLDLIFISRPDKVRSHGQLTAPFSYHDLLFLSYNLRTPKPKKRVVLQRNFAALDIDCLRNDAGMLDWKLVYSADSVDDKVNIILTSLNELFDKHAPVRPVRKKRLPAPWLNSDIKNFMIKRDRAKRKCKRYPTDINIATYKKLRNRCNRMCRNAKRRYIHTALESHSPAQMWKFLKSLGVGKAPDSQSNIHDLNDLNKHFSAPPLVLSDDVKYMSITSLNSSSSNSFTFHDISVNQVVRYIKGLSSKAYGYDGLGKDMLIPIADIIAPAITHLLNCSLSTSTFPYIWKLAHIIPLPKISNPTSSSHFRPISILPVLSKLMEEAVSLQLSSYLSQFQLLTPFQSGFRPRHSTTTALLKVTEDIRFAMDNKMLTVVVLLDFSNAFNSVDFDILLATLRSLGLMPPVIEWFASYLRGRRQRICSDNATSDWADLTTGVPQGGVLSPLLFSIFINGLTKCINSNYHLYADDLQIYRHTSLQDMDEAINEINRDLNGIHSWASSHGLLVNPTKSQALIIGSRQMRSRVNTNVVAKIIYNGALIPYTDQAKNLGLMLNCNLSWSAHVNEVSKRLHHSLHSLKRLQNVLPIPTKILLAQTLLLPILDYADACYLDVTEELLSKLERLQNLCIRFIFGLRRFDHISEFRTKLKWLPIRLRRNTHILIMLYNILTSSSPSYLRDRFLLTPPSERPTRSCTTQKSLVVPSYNTTFYANSYSVVASKLWNALPRDIQSCPSVSSFKSRLKLHLLSTI